jgi:hypothetical protein
LQLHAIAARRLPDQLERVVDVKPVPLRDDAFGLLDRYPRL